MELKKGITLMGVKPELLIGLMVCNSVYSNHNQELVVTAVTDGKHSSTSLHYNGCALDLRTRYFEPSEVEQVAAEIRERLTVDFDVVVESDHIHLEFQPRYASN